MFTTETIMFNLERANQFFMLIMSQPGGPAASFMELQEQIHFLTWACAAICAREVLLQGEPLLGACTPQENKGVRACACECMHMYVHTYASTYMYVHVFVHACVHA